MMQAPVVLRHIIQNLRSELYDDSEAACDFFADAIYIALKDAGFDITKKGTT